MSSLLSTRDGTLFVTDAPMHFNQGRFLQNGQSGYVLQPAFMRTDGYDPYDATTLKGVVDPILLSITITAGRHFVKPGKGIASPFVEVEVAGAEYDCNKYKTETVQESGFNPVWNETCDFESFLNPDLALLRFTVHDIDIFGDPNFLGQASYPVRCLRSGFRSVPLKNGYGEDLELAALLVKVTFKPIRAALARTLTASDHLRPQAASDVKKGRAEAPDAERDLMGEEDATALALPEDDEGEYGQLNEAKSSVL